MKHLQKKERKNFVSNDHSENQSLERVGYPVPADLDAGFQRHRLSPHGKQSHPGPYSTSPRFPRDGDDVERGL